MSSSNRSWWIFLGVIVMFGGVGAWRLAHRVGDVEGADGVRLQIVIRHPSAQRPENLQPAQPPTLKAFRSPWTVKLTGPDGRVVEGQATDLAGTVVFEGLAPGAYKMAVWFLGTGPVATLGSPACQVHEGENAANVTVAPEADEHLTEAMRSADPAFFYGYAQPRFVIPPAVAGVSDMRMVTVTAVPEKLSVAQWAFPVSFALVGQRPTGLPATAYVFTLRLRDREVGQWRQWVPPGMPSVSLPGGPEVVAALSKEDDPTRAVEDVKQAVRRQDRGKVGTALRRLDGQRQWRALESIAAWLREDALGAAELPYTLTDFHDALAKQQAFADVAAHHREWAERLPQSVTARVQLVQDHIAAGFKARGSGFADTVTPQGWRGFHAAVERAEKEVAAALVAGVKDPHLWVERIELATIGEHPAALGASVFDEAVAHAPRYAPIYIDRSWYVLPRWGGAPGEVGRVGDRALKVAGDRGDAIYTLIATRARLAGETPFSPSMGLRWAPVKRQIGRDARAFDLDLLAGLAVEAGDRATARKLFERIETPDPRMWTSTEAYQKARAWALQ